MKLLGTFHFWNKTFNLHLIQIMYKIRKTWTDPETFSDVIWLSKEEGE